MKKNVLMLLLAIALVVPGCGNKEDKEPQISMTVETEKDEESIAEDNTEQDETPAYDINSLNDYMAFVEEQSDSIKNYLENEAFTQDDMNVKSKELYDVWDEALNYLWGELKNYLPEEEFAELKDEQRTWITEKESAVEEAGKEFEGGSMYALAVNSEAAAITEERVYELYELLK